MDQWLMREAQKAERETIHGAFPTPSVIIIIIIINIVVVIIIIIIIMINNKTVIK